MPGGNNNSTTPEPPLEMSVRRVSLPAYSTAITTARGETLPGTAVEAWGELEASGLARDGRLLPEWARALAAAPTAPVRIRIEARAGSVIFETDVVLLPGLGLATTQRSAVIADSYDSAGDDRSFEDAVELVAFPPEQIWPAVRRVLPPHEALRADARPTPISKRTDDNHPHDATASPDAEVSVIVMVTGPDGSSAPFGAHQWALAGDQLYATYAQGAVAVQPGAIAHELIFLVTGAYGAAAALLEGQATR